MFVRLSSRRCGIRSRATVMASTSVHVSPGGGYPSNAQYHNPMHHGQQVAAPSMTGAGDTRHAGQQHSPAAVQQARSVAASQAPKTSERKQIAIMTCGGCLACFCCILLVIAVGLGLRALGGGGNDPDLSTNSGMLHHSRASFYWAPKRWASVTLCAAGGEGRLLATQFAPHRWAMVGDSGTFPASWGPIKSHVPIHGNAGPTVDTATGTWSCDGAGVCCTRFAYRKNDHGGDSNNIQTACTVCVTRMVDATECAGKPALEVDFERALAASDPDKGDADWTTDGDGFFFSVCKDGADILLNTSHVPVRCCCSHCLLGLRRASHVLCAVPISFRRSCFELLTRLGRGLSRWTPPSSACCGLHPLPHGLATKSSLHSSFVSRCWACVLACSCTHCVHRGAQQTHTGPTITSLQLHADGIRM